MTSSKPTLSPVVLSAPAGTGKTTIAQTLVEREEDFSFSISVTTRAPRPGERDGVDYWFVSRQEFRTMVERGELAEWAEVHGDLYGTPHESLIQAGIGGRHVILDIDVQGALQIREAVPEALLLFILPPSMEVLLQRLRGRGTEGQGALRRRLTTALRELEAAETFDFFVVNEDLEKAVAEVLTLARTGKAFPGAASGSLDDAWKLRLEIETLLQREHLLEND